MAEHDRLGRLKMGKAGHHGLRMPGCLLGQGFFDGDHALGELPRHAPQIEARIVCRLVVARPPGAKLAAKRAEARHQQPFEKGMQILVSRNRLLAAGTDIGFDAFQGRAYRGEFTLVQDPGPLQLGSMGARTCNIFLVKPKVRSRRAGQVCKRFGRSGLESSTPKLTGLGHLRSLYLFVISEKLPRVTCHGKRSYFNKL